MSDTKEIIEALNAVVPGATDEQIAIAADRLKFIGEFYREAKKNFDAAMIELLNQTPGKSRTIGNIRYYLAPDKSYKVRNASHAIQTILTIAGGDEDRLIGCLSSGWLKHGATRKLFEEFDKPFLFGEVFETITKDSLENGKPEKTLKAVDTRFLD